MDILNENEICSVCGDLIMGGSEIKEKTICYDCLFEEQKEIITNLSEDKINHVNGFDTLSEPHKTLLVSVYKRHLSGMGTILRNKYMPEKIIEVKYDNGEDTVNIYFKDIWWHYTKDHKWY